MRVEPRVFYPPLVPVCKGRFLFIEELPMDDLKMNITCSPAVSAIYFALLQCGYEFYGLGKNLSLSDEIGAFVNSTEVPSFWKSVRQDSCDAYPYWPRAFMLESATFFLNLQERCFSNFVEYKRHILDMTNIMDCERDESFWSWIQDFPNALAQVIESPGFSKYLRWEREWIRQQNLQFSEEFRVIQKCASACTELYSAPVKNLQILIDPIKCAYSADYHIHGNSLIVTSGRFCVGSVVHEFLHQVVHPVVLDNREDILASELHLPDLDDSYYLEGGKIGRLNAFEEYAVRQLTDAALRDDYPNCLDQFVCSFL